ncbi:cingulin-like protein 1 [Tachysurus vachellii]|uniref:cingulin-like protein 1 n=1 Tax=Tachysurus vachellii TaxID=175792 RepID=UPI00296B377A|nr:cingulin-like protein 1 [Tachysurus vachellii]
MESYKVSGLPNTNSYTHPARARSQNNSSYGLSIRVQGIDGHPYVVLNNQDRELNPYAAPKSNNNDAEGSFIDNYTEYNFRAPREDLSVNPFAEFRAQHQIPYVNNDLSDSRDTQANKPSALLNFQKHPEILQPYDPVRNTIGDFQNISPQPFSLAESRNTYPDSLPKTEKIFSDSKSSKPELPKRTDPPAQDTRKWAQPQVHPQTFPSRVQPQKDLSKGQAQNQPQAKPQVQTQPSFKPQSQSQGQPQSTFQVPSQVSQHAQRLPVPQVSSSTSVPSEPSSYRTPSTTSSTNSSLERRHREPDILPLRRTDSSGPVLQSSRSRNSSMSSTTPTKEEQLEALYGDSINRHENRRYIPFLPGTGRDIDTGSIPGVDELISKFDGKGSQRRGRTGRRNRINLEDRKRSRSVDSALPFGLQGDAEYLDEVGRNRGRSTEHLLRPSQLVQKSPFSSIGRRKAYRDVARISSEPGSPQGAMPSVTDSILFYKKPLSRPSILPVENKGTEVKKITQSTKTVTSVATTSLSRAVPNHSKKTNEMVAETTPDLLKGQQELSQQTHEETAKQILFNYLKDGSNDSDDTTKRKVNLVFEKIQTLKSRATGSVQGDNRSPDLSVQAKALQEQKAELEKEVASLKKQLEDENKKKKGLSEQQEKAGAGIKKLQKELEFNQAECDKLQDKLSKAEADLRTTLEELFQVKMEREQYQTEIRDLQDQLSEMHDELDGAQRLQLDSAEKEDLMRLKLDLQEALMVKEEQEDLLRRRERELTALKGALKEEVSTHDLEVDKLREQYDKEIRKLQASLVEVKQSNAAVSKEKSDVEAAKGAAEGQAGRLSQEVERLRKRVQELENEVAKLNRIIDEAKLLESKLDEKARRLEKEKRQVEESLNEVKEEEEEMSRANRALTARLEDVQRNLTKLTQEHRELEERLKEERSQKEQFKNTKNEIEEERRLLDRTVEKLQREMCEIVEASQCSTQELQEQIDTYKEKNRRELAELQRQLRDGGLELEKSRITAKSLQEKVGQLEEDLRFCKRERDEAEERTKALQQKVFALEVDADTKVQNNDKARQIKLLEEQVSHLEIELDEERQNGDLLMDRIDRGREQMEQLRSELLQERASKQDLECDKIALDRQNKDLKSRISHLENSQKSSKEGLVAQLESRIQELEERLEAEERDRANLQLVNRRLERKVKEMVMQMDEEQHSLQDQKDQLNLRLKALKRQMDEAEEEIDRLEHSKKKLQRDLEEQQEVNEQLQNQLKALRSEIRRKTSSAPLINNMHDDDDDDDDDISTDGETYFSSASGYKRSSSQDAIINTLSL